MAQGLKKQNKTLILKRRVYSGFYFPAAARALPLRAAVQEFLCVSRF
jgi:hypothetical protein